MSAELERGRVAIALGWIDSRIAGECLQEAQRTGTSILNVAVARGLLSPQQAQSVEEQVILRSQQSLMNSREGAGLLQSSRSTPGPQPSLSESQRSAQVQPIDPNLTASARAAQSLTGSHRSQNSYVLAIDSAQLQVNQSQRGNNSLGGLTQSTRTSSGLGPQTPTPHNPRTPSGGLTGTPRSAGNAAPLPQVGDFVGPYRVLRMLGQGGMGAVYEVDEPGATKTHYALKLMTSLDPKARKRFEREAQAAAAVDRHANIVAIHGFQAEGETPYLVMDYIAGKGLDSKLRDSQTLPWTEALSILEKIARALDFIHSQGIVHRDMKPGNILIREDGEPFLTDFGLARAEDSERLTQTNESLGTPAYMSPEQAVGNVDAIGPRSDIFSLGVILYESLAGRRPFEGPSVAELMARITVGQHEPMRNLRPDLKINIDAVLDVALAKEAEHRYASAAELADDLARILRGEAAMGSGSSLGSRIGRGVRRRLGVHGSPMLALGFLALTFFLGLALWTARTQLLRSGRMGEMAMHSRRCAEELEAIRAALPVLALSQCAPAMGEVDLPAGFDAHAAELIAAWAELKQCLDEARLSGYGDLVANAEASSHKERWATFIALIRAFRGSPKALDDDRDADLIYRALMGSAEIPSLDQVSRWPEDLRILLSLARFLKANREQHWKEAEELLAELAPRLGPGAALLREQVTLNATLQALIKPDAPASELRQAVSQLEDYGRERSWSPAELWAAMNATLAKSLWSDIAALKIEDIERRDARLQALARGLDRIQIPPPPAETCSLLAERAAARGEKLEAFRFYFLRRLREPDFRLPKGYGLSALSRAANELRGLEINIEKLFETALIVARTGVFFFLIDPDMFRAAVDGGMVERELRRCPDDPYPRFFRANLRFQQPSKADIQSGAYKAGLLARIADLDAVISNPKSAPVYVGKALEHRADVLAHLENTGESGLRERLLQDSYRAIAMPHPDPDRAMNNLAERLFVDGRYAEALPILEREEAIIQRRFELTASNQLGEPEFLEVGQIPLFEDARDKYLSANAFWRGATLSRLNRNNEAITWLERCISIKVSKDTEALELLINILLVEKGADEAKATFEKHRSVARDAASRQRIQAAIQAASKAISESPR